MDNALHGIALILPCKVQYSMLLHLTDVIYIYVAMAEHMVLVKVEGKYVPAPILAGFDKPQIWQHYFLGSQIIPNVAKAWFTETFCKPNIENYI